MPGKVQVGFPLLLETASSLRFEPHDIRQSLDRTGHYELPFQREFPLSIRLFQFQSQRFTNELTWHEQLELFLPLDGPAEVKMGEQQLRLEAGDLLVMDNLKLHQVIDFDSFNTRVVVISFLPEFVYSLGSPSHDFAFLLPFYAQIESQPHVLRRNNPVGTEAHAALADLLRFYFGGNVTKYREAGCKAALLTLLFRLVTVFQNAEVMRWEFERQRQQASRFTRLLERLQRQPTEKIPLKEAAKLCGMSTAQFTRSFKQVAGMTYVAYITHLRLAEVARLLKAGELTISEIAARIGFSDQSHLDRRFKDSFGISPREYQQRNRALRQPIV